MFRCLGLCNVSVRKACFFFSKLDILNKEVCRGLRRLLQIKFVVKNSHFVDWKQIASTCYVTSK